MLSWGDEGGSVVGPGRQVVQSVVGDRPVGGVRCRYAGVTGGVERGTE